MKTLTKEQKATRRKKNRRRYEAKQAKRGDKSMRKPLPLTPKQLADFGKGVSAFGAFLGIQKGARRGRRR